jgi:hypothetical protein
VSYIDTLQKEEEEKNPVLEPLFSLVHSAEGLGLEYGGTNCCVNFTDVEHCRRLLNTIIASGQIPFFYIPLVQDDDSLVDEISVMIIRLQGQPDKTIMEKFSPCSILSDEKYSYVIARFAPVAVKKQRMRIAKAINRIVSGILNAKVVPTVPILHTRFISYSEAMNNKLRETILQSIAASDPKENQDSGLPVWECEALELISAPELQPKPLGDVANGLLREGTFTLVKLLQSQRTLTVLRIALEISQGVNVLDKFQAAKRSVIFIDAMCGPRTVAEYIPRLTDHSPEKNLAFCFYPNLQFQKPAFRSSFESMLRKNQGALVVLQGIRFDEKNTYQIISWLKSCCDKYGTTFLISVIGDELDFYADSILEFDLIDGRTRLRIRTWNEKGGEVNDKGND